MEPIQPGTVACEAIGTECGYAPFWQTWFATRGLLLSLCHVHSTFMLSEMHSCCNALHTPLHACMSLRPSFLPLPCVVRWHQHTPQGYADGSYAIMPP